MYNSLTKVGWPVAMWHNSTLVDYGYHFKLYNYLVGVHTPPPPAKHLYNIIVISINTIQVHKPLTLVTNLITDSNMISRFN